MRRKRPAQRPPQAERSVPQVRRTENPEPMQQRPPEGSAAPTQPVRRRRASQQSGLSRSERQRRQIRRARRRRFARQISFLILTLGMAFLAVTVFFRLDKLKVTGTEHYTAEQIAETLGVEKGDNLFSFRISTLEGKLMKEYPYLSRVEIARALPDVLTVKAVDAVPVAAVDVEGGGCYLIDANGKMLEQAPRVPEGVAPVTGATVSEGKPGEIISEKGNSGALLRLTKALDEAGILGDVDFINVSATYDVRFGYLGRLDVRLGQADALAQKLRMLAVIVRDELSPNDVNIVDLSDPATAYCPPTTKQQIEQSMLPLEDIVPLGQSPVQEPN